MEKSNEMKAENVKDATWTVINRILFGTRLFNKMIKRSKIIVGRIVNENQGKGKKCLIS